MDPLDGKLHSPDHELLKKNGQASPCFWCLRLILRRWIIPGHPQRRFISLMWPHKTILLQSLFGAIACSLLGLTFSVYVQKIVDHVLVDGNINLLNMMSLVMIIFLLLRIFISLWKSIFTLRTGQQIDARLIMGYYRHLLKLPAAFFRHHAYRGNYIPDQ